MHKISNFAENAIPLKKIDEEMDDEEDEESMQRENQTEVQELFHTQLSMKKSDKSNPLKELREHVQKKNS